MSDIEKLLKDAVLGTIGAAATVVEKSSEFVQTMIRKGEETLKENQEFTDEMVRKGQKVVDSVAQGIKNAAEQAKTAVNETPEEDQAEDAQEAAEEAPEQETAEETEEAAAEEAVDEPEYSAEDDQANG